MRLWVARQATTKQDGKDKEGVQRLFGEAEKDEPTFIAFSKGANAEYRARRELNWTLYAGSGMRAARGRRRTGVRTTGVPLMVATQYRTEKAAYFTKTTRHNRERTRLREEGI